MTFGWIANRGWYDGDLQRVANVRTALQSSARWANSNHAATAAMSARYSRVPADVLMAENRQPSSMRPLATGFCRMGSRRRSCSRRIRRDRLTVPGFDEGKTGHTQGA